MKQLIKTFYNFINEAETSATNPKWEYLYSKLHSKAKEIKSSPIDVSLNWRSTSHDTDGFYDIVLAIGTWHQEVHLVGNNSATIFNMRTTLIAAGLEDSQVWKKGQRSVNLSYSKLDEVKVGEALDSIIKEYELIK